ncbi:hypothetical protein T4E_12061 [Trichinella pseudospiralis]|uniref:Uncharacterized protein n=1 Tax=Trichinella pseudospiralis TaxID=6337 RepID=A0A0V1FDL7_TRIPS|nr:hypothetical protein T4E_12061 [Trichinella pseudospiralis]KRY84014.1 hypothetical protein T4D_16996 [Trichinella pseudospiralis]
MVAFELSGLHFFGIDRVIITAVSDCLYSPTNADQAKLHSMQDTSRGLNAAVEATSATDISHAQQQLLLQRFLCTH